MSVSFVKSPRFEDNVFDTLLNPIVIVEVLSPSTEAYDRGEKFPHYHQLQSLQEYILVSQDKVCVEHYVRQTEQWVLLTFKNLNSNFCSPQSNANYPYKKYTKTSRSLSRTHQYPEDGSFFDGGFSNPISVLSGFLSLIFHLPSRPNYAKIPVA